jgi:hypothetical protein
VFSLFERVEFIGDKYASDQKFKLLENQVGIIMNISDRSTDGTPYYLVRFYENKGAYVDFDLSLKSLRSLP